MFAQSCLPQRVVGTPRSHVCFTFGMKQWDGAASARLDEVCGHLQEAGVVDLFRNRVRKVWRRNVNGFAPSEGDTSLSLGITCAENLRELIIGDCAGDNSPWKTRNVRALNIERSLRVEVGGLRLGLMKAPPSQTRTPLWNGTSFNWQQESDVRRLAAQRNSHAYRPSTSDQADRQMALGGSGETESAPDAMQDLLVVWSGQLEEPLTAGWVGFPSSGFPSWYAVALLWWDEPTEGSLERRSNEPVKRPGSFTELPVPAPIVKLKHGSGDSGTASR